MSTVAYPGVFLSGPHCATALAPRPRPKELTKAFVTRTFNDAVQNHFVGETVTAVTQRALPFAAQAITSSLWPVGGRLNSITTDAGLSDFTVTANCTVPTIGTGTVYEYSAGEPLGFGSGEFTINMTVNTATGASDLGVWAVDGNGAIAWDHQPDFLTNQIKAVLKGNLLIRTNTRSRIGGIKSTPQEMKARQTLRDIITEKDWRRYITNGFVMVKGPSGRYYQIFANRSHTVVWEKNKKIHELCIVTDNDCPPTDHVITIKTMVELDEQSVWDEANLRAVGYRDFSSDFPPRQGPMVSLLQRVKELNLANKSYDAAEISIWTLAV